MQTGSLNPTSQAELPAQSTEKYFAAVDLGSNSFHLIVARYSHGQLLVVDRLREMVQLRMGLDKKRRLSSEARDRALACLLRFGERLRDIPSSQVRVVGTNTLRKLRDRGVFLTEAEAALGHSIDIISGIEEARLVYLGALSSLPLEDARSLVVDIGGGSTELVVGKGSHPQALESLEMGCVSYSRKYFPKGKMSRWRFRRARLAARQELTPIVRKMAKHEWTDAIGTSGTARAIADIEQILSPGSQGVSLSGMRALMKHCAQLGNTDQLDFPELSPERAAVLPGGLAILVEVCKRFGIENMSIAEGALREGILYDLIGRYADEDARVASVRSMSARYHVDEEQAERVAETALKLFDQIADDAGLHGYDYRKLLEWAARLHEVGLDIAHARYNHHGSYLVRHTDMPGFTRREQLILSVLVGQHRRKIRSEAFKELPKANRKPLLLLVAVLRLAVLLNRSRGNDSLPDFKLAWSKDQLLLNYPRGWLRDNPLSRADLSEERRYLKGHVDLRAKAFPSGKAGKKSTG